MKSLIYLTEEVPAFSRPKIRIGYGITRFNSISDNDIDDLPIEEYLK